jgi:hypothetical protein
MKKLNTYQKLIFSLDGDITAGTASGVVDQKFVSA